MLPTGSIPMEGRADARRRRETDQHCRAFAPTIREGDRQADADLPERDEFTSPSVLIIDNELYAVSYANQNVYKYAIA